MVRSRRVSEAGSVSKRRGEAMQVADVIEAGGVLLRPPCGTFEEGVRSLVEVLVAHDRIAPALRDAAVRAVCEREAMASTAIVEIGVSVPHARLEGVDGVAGALAVSPTAVYYAMTGVPIFIMVLVLSAPDLAGEHLNLLAGFSMLLQSESVRRRLQQATDNAGALTVLRVPSGLPL